MEKRISGWGRLGKRRKWGKTAPCLACWTEWRSLLRAGDQRWGPLSGNNRFGQTRPQTSWFEILVENESWGGEHSHRLWKELAPFWPFKAGALGASQDDAPSDCMMRNLLWGALVAVGAGRRDRHRGKGKNGTWHWATDLWPTDLC